MSDQADSELPKPEPPPFKTRLSQHISQNELGEAIELLRTDIPEEDEMAMELVMLSRQWEEIRKAQSIGNVSQEDLQLLRNDLAFDIYGLGRRWDKKKHSPPPGPRELKKRGIHEEGFKRFLFLAIVLVKGGLLAFLFYLNETGSFILRDYLNLNGLMLPVFSASVILMIRHFFDNKDKNPDPEGPYIGRMLQWITYISLAAYLLIYLLSLRQYSTESMGYEGLLSRVSGIEALFGAILGYIISELFKKERPD